MGCNKEGVRRNQKFTLGDITLAITKKSLISGSASTHTKSATPAASKLTSEKLQAAQRLTAPKLAAIRAPKLAAIRAPKLMQNF